MDKRFNADLLKDSVEARQDILQKGFFDKISDKLNKMILENNSRYDILDSGSGTGYYDNRLFCFLKKNGKTPNISGFDISKNAVDFAKNCYPHLDFFESDVNDIKTPDKSKDIIITILAPKNYKEYDRILRDDGKLYIIGYNVKEHIKEILDFVGTKRETKKQPIYKTLDENGFKILKKEEIKLQIEFDNESLIETIKTIPEYLTFDAEKVQELFKIKTFKVTLDFVIYETIKKDFFKNNLQQKFADRAGCIIISKENPKNIAISYDKMDKSLFFPKGHIDEGELAEKTAIRETEEETGIKIKIIKPLKEFKNTSIYNPNDTHNISFFIADSLNDEIDENIKIEAHIVTFWIDYREILNLNFKKTFMDFYLDNFKEIKDYIEWKLEN